MTMGLDTRERLVFTIPGLRGHRPFQRVKVAVQSRVDRHMRGRDFNRCFRIEPGVLHLFSDSAEFAVMEQPSSSLWSVSDEVWADPRAGDCFVLTFPGMEALTVSSAG